MGVALAESVDRAAPAAPIESLALLEPEELDGPAVEGHSTEVEGHSTEHDEVCPYCAKSIHRIVLRQGLPSKDLLEAILFHRRAGDAHSAMPRIATSAQSRIT